MVLGSSGMVGSRVADHLAQSGYRVMGLSRHLQSALLHGWDAHQVDSYGKTGIDLEAHAIVNCAGPTSKWAEENPEQFQLFAHEHASNIRELRKQTGAQHVVNLSTVHVYAKEFNGLVSETHPHENDHPYASGHSMLEGLLSEQNNVANLRISNSYGASRGLSSSSWGLFTQDLVRQFVATGNAQIRGNPSGKRDFIPLSDVVAAMQHVLSTRSTGAFNVVSSKTLRLADWAKYLAKVGSTILDRELFVDDANPGIEVPEYSFASDKLKGAGYSHPDNPQNELESLFKLAIEDRDEG
jgi:nucleoside-diphosphate-sugar epimerase